jgi:hypothetical protein
MPALVLMGENQDDSINIINENIEKAIEMTPVIFSLFGNENIDTTEFGLTNKSDFYLGAVMVSALDLIADNYRQRYAKPIPDTEKITALSIILRRLPDFKKAIRELGI